MGILVVSGRGRLEVGARTDLVILSADPTAVPRDAWSNGTDAIRVEATVAAVKTEVVGAVGTVLADSGYYSEAAVKAVEANGGPQVLAGTRTSSPGERSISLVIQTSGGSMASSALLAG